MGAADVVEAEDDVARLALGSDGEVVELDDFLVSSGCTHVGRYRLGDLRPEQSGIYAGEGAVDQTKTIRSQGWTDTKSFKVYNKGTADFTVGFMNADGVPVAVGQAMAPGTNQTFTAAALGYNPVMHYLNISPAAATAAKWLVEML